VIFDPEDRISTVTSEDSSGSLCDLCPVNETILPNGIAEGRSGFVLETHHVFGEPEGSFCQPVPTAWVIRTVSFTGAQIDREPEESSLVTVLIRSSGSKSRKLTREQTNPADSTRVVEFGVLAHHRVFRTRGTLVRRFVWSDSRFLTTRNNGFPCFRPDAAIQWEIDSDGKHACARCHRFYPKQRAPP